MGVKSEKNPRKILLILAVTYILASLPAIMIAGPARIKVSSSVPAASHPEARSRAPGCYPPYKYAALNRFPKHKKIARSSRFLGACLFVS